LSSRGCPSDDALAALIAGNLDPEEIRRIHAHAESCGSCRRALVELALHEDGVTERSGVSASSGPEAARVPVASSTTPLGSGDAVGRYHILDHVASGGMGSVYAAYDPELDRRVALKVIRIKSSSGADRDDLPVRLLREAQAMARLSHPNVVAVHDVGTYGGQVFLAM
jgi:eukaryotic-like serine/threonine-protein kinase